MPRRDRRCRVPLGADGCGCDRDPAFSCGVVRPTPGPQCHRGRRLRTRRSCCRWHGLEHSTPSLMGSLGRTGRAGRRSQPGDLGNGCYRRESAGAAQHGRSGLRAPWRFLVGHAVRWLPDPDRLTVHSAGISIRAAPVVSGSIGPAHLALVGRLRLERRDRVGRVSARVARASITPAARGRPGPGPARTGSHPHQLRAGAHLYRVDAPWAGSPPRVRPPRRVLDAGLAARYTR